MFSFFVKKSEVVLDCFTYNKIIFDTTPIAEARHFFPKWWKECPRTFEEEHEFLGHITKPTIKTCIGLSNYFLDGFVIPLWSDVIIKSTEDNFYFQFRETNSSTIQTHSPKSFNFIFSENFHHIKLVSPWLFRCKEEIHFLFSPATWNTITNFNFNNVYILHGVNEFKYQHGTHVNLLIPKKEACIKLDCNTPIIYFYPKSEKKIIIKNHLISFEEYKKLNDIHCFFDNSYRNRRKLLKSIEKRK